MLTQYRLTLQPETAERPRPELAYRLYAALLGKAPQRFVQSAHEDAVTPISQFLSVEKGGAPLWTVNLIGERSEEALSGVLEELEQLELDRGGRVLVTERSRTELRGVEELFALAERGGSLHRLEFRTPTAFKSQGQYLNLPTARLLLQSLIRKWNGSIRECPIEDEDGAGLDALAAGLCCTGFQLRDRLYYLKGNAVPGFIGSMVLENRSEGFHRLLTDALLRFSAFAGVGVKTTLGMGGVERR